LELEEVVLGVVSLTFGISMPMSDQWQMQILKPQTGGVEKTVDELDWGF